MTFTDTISAAGVVPLGIFSDSQFPPVVVLIAAVKGSAAPELARFTVCAGTTAVFVAAVKVKLVGVAVRFGFAVVGCTFNVTATFCGVFDAPAAAMVTDAQAEGRGAAVRLVN